MGNIIRKILIFFVFILLLGISALLIYAGIYFNKISDKNYIYETAIDNIFAKIGDIITIDESYIIGDSFMIEGNIKYDLKSDYYEKNKTVNDEFAKKYNLLNNLSLLETNYIIAQDYNNKKFYTYNNGKIKEKDIFINKKLIENSTEYLFYNGVDEQYINNGNNTYFEVLNADNHTTDNITYLFTLIRDSIKSHITSDDLETYDVKTYVGDKEIDTIQVSYQITDDSLKKLYKSVLKDIKKDSKAKDIMSLLCSDLNCLNLNEKERIIPKGKMYTFNIYVSKKLYEPLKYELVCKQDNSKETYTYEGDLEKGYFYYVIDNEVKYSANYKSNSKKTDIEVFNRFNNPMGSINLEKDKDTNIFNLTLDFEDKKYDITYHKQNEDLKDSEYLQKITLTFKILDESINRIQGEIKTESKISKNVNINEDITNAVLRVGFNEEQEEKFKTHYDNIIKSLES